MDPSALFQVVNTGILPAWALLAFAPRWRWTQKLIHGIWIPFLLTLVYVYALVAAGPPPEGGGFGSLQEVMVLFSSPMAVVAGWTHYLVFDLFVGAWEVRDAQRRGIPHRWILIPLFFTLMLGPVGLSLYLLLRWFRTGTTDLQECTPPRRRPPDMPLVG